MRLNRRLVMLVTGLGAAAGIASVAAQVPPPGPPTDYLPYGKVQVAGENISPAVQPVVAFVNGQICGTGQTLIATEGDNVPAGDVGRTVYTIDIMADGDRVDQQPGCGKPGDEVRLFFPESRRAATQTLSFKQGSERVDLTLGEALQYRVVAPSSARDGTN